MSVVEEQPGGTHSGENVEGRGHAAQLRSRFLRLIAEFEYFRCSSLRENPRVRRLVCVAMPTDTDE